MKRPGSDFFYFYSIMKKKYKKKVWRIKMQSAAELKSLLNRIDHKGQTPGSQTPPSSASTVRHDCPHRCHGSSDWNPSYLLPPTQICLAGFRAKKIEPRPILVFKEWAKALCNRIPDIIFLQNSSELAKRSWHCFSFCFSRIFIKNLSRIWG